MNLPEGSAEKGGLNSLAMLCVGGGVAVLLGQLDADPINWGRVLLSLIVVMIGIGLPFLREARKEALRRRRIALEERGEVIPSEEDEELTEAVPEDNEDSEDNDTEPLPELELELEPEEGEEDNFIPDDGDE